MKFSIAILLTIYNLNQSIYFEGRVRYWQTDFNDKGEIITEELPVEIQDDYYDSTRKISKVVKGYFKNFANYDLLIDLEKKSRFEIWENERKIIDIGVEPQQAVDYIIERTSLKEKILNHTCTLYKVKRKERLLIDTLYIDLFTADDLQIGNLKEIVKVQGNMSTAHLNGEVPGLPLKMILRTATTKTQIIAVEIEQGHVLASLDDYFIGTRVKK